MRRSNSFQILLALAALCIVTACGSSDTPPPSAPPSLSPPPPAPPPSTEKSISPSATNQALVANLSPHFVVNPDPGALAARRLFVMLPGTGAVARTYQDIVRLGARRGYHAIGLTYPNDEAIGTLCAASADPDCAGRARLEVITGADASQLETVDPANSIDGRLRALLVYLDANYPSEGWGQYLNAGQVDWSLVTVAGHSQGGGHAGYMAKLRDLNRVVMFSSPADPGPSPGAPAQWLSLPDITPVARQFGFTHVGDTLAAFAIVTASWRTIGLDMFGPVTSVDGAPAPYANSHQLSTNAPPNPNPTGPTASPTHGAPVVDAVTPRDANGLPLFEPVWTYLAFP